MDRFCWTAAHGRTGEVEEKDGEKTDRLPCQYSQLVVFGRRIKRRRVSWRFSCTFCVFFWPSPTCQFSKFISSRPPHSAGRYGGSPGQDWSLEKESKLGEFSGARAHWPFGKRPERLPVGILPYSTRACTTTRTGDRSPTGACHATLGASLCVGKEVLSRSSAFSSQTSASTEQVETGKRPTHRCARCYLLLRLDIDDMLENGRTIT